MARPTSPVLQVDEVPARKNNLIRPGAVGPNVTRNKLWRTGATVLASVYASLAYIYGLNDKTLMMFFNTMLAAFNVYEACKAHSRVKDLRRQDPDR